jgi:hypothetical protein
MQNLLLNNTKYHFSYGDDGLAIETPNQVVINLHVPNPKPTIVL